MNIELFENTKLAAYFLWESTKYDNALALWYCAEDLACYMERNGFLSVADIDRIRSKGAFDFNYVYLIRNIAFRIFIYTNESTATTNWFAAENLLTNREWCEAVMKMAAIYHSHDQFDTIMSDVRSEEVRAYYASTR